MKTTSFLLSFLLAGSLAVTGVSSALAQNYPPEGTITTQGHGEVKVKPDSLSVSVMVESTSATLAAARTENNRKMQAIISVLKNLDIPLLKMETQNLQVYPMQTQQEKSRLPKTIGYRATNGLNVNVQKADPAKLGEYAGRIADAALNTGATHLNSMGFYLDDMTAARGKALEAAIGNARENANAMARAAGLTISGVHSIEGSPQYMAFRNFNYAPMAAKTMEADAGAPPVETGEETISSDVTVRFKF